MNHEMQTTSLLILYENGFMRGERPGFIRLSGAGGDMAT
jgi:hypothetical protein